MCDFSKLSIWQVSREYAGIAEAGGVKNVVCSLSEGLSALNANVTLFIPLYGCTILNSVSDYHIIEDSAEIIFVQDNEYKVTFAKAKTNGINIVFVISDCFSEKMGVYTYTDSEQAANPLFKKGTGHLDASEIEILFQKAVVLYGAKYKSIPNVIHCHDATTAFIPVFANQTDFKPFYKDVKFLVTIHNAGPAYHHQIETLKKAKELTKLDDDVLQKGLVNGQVEPYFLASYYSTLTTVSPFYAEEITNPQNEFTDGLSKAFVENKIKIYGITNGIDFEKYNPTDVAKSLLPYPYNPETLDLSGKYKALNQFTDSFSVNPAKAPFAGIEQFGFLDNISDDTVFFAYHGRLVHQKGLDVLSKAIPLCLAKANNLRFIITGQGASDLEDQQIELTKQFPGTVLYLRGYEKSLAREAVAICDYIVLPSFFEPCGLEDFIASILGTVPLAHKTGGLNKILNNETGFLYSKNDAETLATKILEAASLKQNNQKKYYEILKNAANYVHSKYDWIKVIQNEYSSLLFD